MLLSLNGALSGAPTACMTRKILLIDYESHSAERVRGVLREPDYEIVPAHDGEEALNIFSSTRFDLILLSGMLPRLPSAEVIREIRRRGGATAPPILLMVSGYKGSNAKADAQRVGAFDLLSRPFSDETLRESATAAIAASDATNRAAPSNAPARPGLTSSDIFADVLEEFAREPPRPASARSAQATEEEVEKRLRDTLSGVLPKTAAPVGKPQAARSAKDDVDRLLADTLSGLRTARARPAPAAEPAAAPAGPAPAAASADRFGQYEILERIASGGMAELFRARFRGAEGFQKIVAVKKILPHIAGDEEFLTMFADEAKLAAQLNHPNIVHIFDLGKIESGGYFIAMEFVDGRDLRSILQLARDTGLRMPVPLAVSIGARVAAALDYAHRRRGDDGRELHIVHRDVSPPNILVSTDGDIKLCDFGIARAASKVSRTESGALKGKVPYMSPEQAWGKGVDQRSDIYSLGAVIFELVAGRRLYRGESEMETLEKVRAGEVVAPSTLNPEVPPAIDAALLKALAREPDGRYANVSEMLRDLEAVLRTYEPPPSSAELAIYVHHLETEEAALKAARAREAEPPPAPAAAPAARPPKPKPARVPLPKAPEAAARPAAGPASAPAPSVPPAPPAAPERPPAPIAAQEGIFAGTFPEGPAGSEAKRRKRLYIMIAAASVVLAVAGWLVVRKPAAAPVPVPAATPSPRPPSRVATHRPRRRLRAERRRPRSSASGSASGARRAPAGRDMPPASRRRPACRPDGSAATARAHTRSQGGAGAATGPCRAHGCAGAARTSAHGGAASGRSRSRPGFPRGSRRTRRGRRRARAPLVSEDRVSGRRPSAADLGEGGGPGPRERGRRRLGREAATGGHLPVRRQRGRSRCHPAREIPAGFQERDSGHDGTHDRRKP
jgi:serine/threonine protein kinase/DNA-binding response OmpR family regulator